MKKSLLALAVGALLAMPCVLHAEEIEIQLVEVIQMTPLPGDNPLDDPEQSEPTPTRPRDFRATINGNTLSSEKREAAIPSAQAIVVNAATGGLVLNQSMTDSMEETISNTGVYVLHIVTEGGALTGQFVVQ